MRERARGMLRVAGPRAARALAVAGLLAATGCTAEAGAAPAIQLATAYVPVPQSPGTTVAYLVIRNNGPADRLVAARTSAGGQVTFRAPSGPGVMRMHTVPVIPVPAHSTVSLVPDRAHLLITGAGPLRGGKDIMLTLVFARAGRVSVVAQVTNPQTGGSSYFLS